MQGRCRVCARGALLGKAREVVLSTKGSGELGARGHRPSQDARRAKALIQGVKLVTETRAAFLAPPRSGHGSPHPLAAGPEPRGQVAGPWPNPQLSVGQHSAPAPAALPACLPEVLHLFEACICVQTMSSNFKPVCHAFNPDTSFVTISLASGVQCKEVVRNKESKRRSQQLQGPSPAHPRTLAPLSKAPRPRACARSLAGSGCIPRHFSCCQIYVGWEQPLTGSCRSEGNPPPSTVWAPRKWGHCSPCKGTTVLARRKHGLGLPVNGSKACGLNRGLALYGLE